MEQHKIKEALSLDIFLHSLLQLEDSKSDEESDENEKNNIFVTPTTDQELELQPHSYMFELDKPRKWIKDVMIEDSSESEEESIEELLRLHQKSKLFRNQCHSDPMLAKYMYYSSDSLTGENKYPAHRHAVEKKCLKRKAHSNKQNRAKRSNASSFQDGSVRSYHHQRGKGHSVSDKITHGNMVKKRALTLSRKRSMNMAAMRRYIWKIIVRKEIPKAYRQHVQNQTNKVAVLKKASKDASKKVRAKAHESRLRARKEFQIARARRMTREAQLFWKKYVRVEKSQRKHAEKQALTQRRIEDEKREAFKQEQKLRFLITQTELYAQFVSGKSAEEVLQDNTSVKLVQSPEEISPGINVVDSDVEDAEYSDGRAFENANTAFQLHQSKLKMYSNAENLFKDRTLDDSSSTDIPQPSLLCGQLTGYQLAGVNWLFNLYRHGLNGILADDMGLGKTVQTIAYFAGLAEIHNVWGPFLVIAPASTLNNWHQEFSRFLPSFKVLPYWGTTSERKVLRLFWNQKSEAKADSDTPFHVLITSYQLATTDMRYFQKIPWNYIVFDEAHALKSSNSIRWRTLLDFNCRNRLLLTGTPVQNTMAELWALLHFIMPSLFDDHTEFNEWFAKNIESYADSKSSIHESDLTRLHRILKPFILRRLKCDVEHELTEKVEVRVLCQLSPRQKVLYDALQKNILVKELLRAQSYSGQSTNNIVLMNLVMQFRKVCNHPDIFHSREATSPFSMKSPTFIFPRLIHNSFFTPTSTRRESIKLCYFDLNVHTSFNVQRSLEELSSDETVSSFSFLRLIHLNSGDHWKTFSGSLNERFEQIRNLESMKRRQIHYKLFRNNHYECYFRTVPFFAKRNCDEKSLDCGARSPSLYLTNLHDLCNYSSLSESLLTNLLFVGHKRMTYGHMNHTITCLTNTDSVISSQRQHEDKTNSPIKKNTLASLNRHRVVAAVRNNVVTEIAADFTNLYIPKVVSSPRDVYCDDIGALRRFKMINTCVKATFAGKNLPSINPVRVPDRELLVSDSGKLVALDMLLRRLKDGGHRVLIYSQMTKMIDILEEYMLMRRHSYVRLDGSCRISSRRDTVAGFQSCDEIFVFLLSTRAGGLGINLTAADTVIFYDSDWNPTVDQQAMDRAHRLGQTKQVTVYRLVCKGTVDERILARAQAKSTIQRMVIQDGGFKNDPLNQTEMVSLLLDDDHIAKASQSDDVLKSSLEKAKMTGKRKYRRKANMDGRGRKKRTRSEKTEDCDKLTSKDVSYKAIETEPCATTDTKDLNSSGSTDDQLLVVDDLPVTSASNASTITRGQRKRGRPRLKPVVSGRTRLSRSPLQKRRLGVRGRGRGFRGSRRGRSFSGRAAAMAGARAGALAATAATLQSQASTSSRF